MRFKVAKGCSIIDRGRVLHKAGSLITTDKHMTKADCEGHVKSGHLIPVAEAADPTPGDANLLVENAPGVQTPTPLKSSEDEKDQVRTNAVKVESGITKIETLPEKKVQQVKTLWNFDPKRIAKKGVDELNVMILERDDKVVPFETKEEALAFMTQDTGKEGRDMVVTQTGPTSEKTENRVATAD